MIKNKVASHLNTNLAFQITIAFTIVFLLKWQILDQPPVWDEAFSVFPAAITLSESGFDLLNLLKMPGYLDGGPNVHANSIITIITAVVISLLGKTNFLFPALHLFHFVITATGLTFFYRFCIPVLGKKLSFLLALTILVYPVFLTQTGYMYLEIPTFLFSILCLSSWVNGNFFRTIIFAILATLSKESGIIVVVTVAMASFLEPTSFKDRIIRFFSIFTIPAILVATSSLRIHTFTKEQDYGSLFNKIINLIIYQRIHNVGRYLFNTPDLLFAMIMFVALLPFCFPTFWHGLTNVNILNSKNPKLIAQKYVSLSALFLVNFFGFYYVAVPLLRENDNVLIRYYVLAIPFLFLTIMWFLSIKLKINRKTLSALLIISVVFFYLNRNGAFYPNEVETLGNDFSIAERSAAYTDLLLVQQKSIQYIEKIALQHTVFYGLPIHFLTKYPLMRYSSGPLKQGECIQFMDAKLENLPNCFYMLKISPFLGAKKMTDVFNEALSNPNYLAVRNKLFSKGNYYSEIFKINRHNESCSFNNELFHKNESDND